MAILRWSRNGGQKKDVHFFCYGNPDLATELTDAYEVSYNTLIHAAPVIFSGTVRHTGNAIEAVRLPTATPGVTAQTYANVATVTYYQLTLHGTAKFTKQWEVSGGPNAQYVVFLSPDRDLLRRGFSAGMYADTSYHFARHFTAQASVSGALPTPILALVKSLVQKLIGGLGNCRLSVRMNNHLAVA